MCDEKCDIKSLNGHTEGQTHRWIDRKVKTKGFKIMYKDIRYLDTVVIGGPIKGTITLLPR